MTRNEFWAEQFLQAVQAFDKYSRDYATAALLAQDAGQWADITLVEFDKRFPGTP